MDQYIMRPVKISLKKIIRKSEYQNIIFNMACNMNTFITNVYRFLRLWILNRIKNKLSISTLNKQIIKLIFRLLKAKKQGPEVTEYVEL